MEIDVSISTPDDGVGRNFKNIVHLSLSDTDSSINSLLSGIESDSNDSTGSSISSQNRNNSAVISHKSSSPDCEMLKLHSYDKINKITCETVLKPVEATIRGLRNTTEADCTKAVTCKTSVKNNKSRNVLGIPDKKLCKSVHSSHSKNLAGLSIKSKKRIMSIPINQSLVVCTKENELKMASIQSLMQNEIVIGTSNILEGQSAKKKIRQVFPTKITKSRLSNIMDDLDVSVEKPQRGKPKKKLKENNFGDVELPTIHSVIEVKDQLNLQSNSDSHESFKHKRKSHLLISQAKESHKSYLSKNKAMNTDSDIGEKKIYIGSAHAETLKNNAVSENIHDGHILHDISDTPGTFDIHKNASFGKQSIQSENEQMPKPCDRSEKDPEIVNISKPKDLIKRLKLDRPSLKLSVTNNNTVLYPDANHSAQHISFSPKIIYNNSEMCDDSNRNKVCSKPCTPIVGRISPIKSAESTSGPAKSVVPRLHICKSMQRSSFQSSSLPKCNNYLTDLDCKVVSKVTKIIPNYSGDFVEPSLNLSQEMLKEKLGLVAKNGKSRPTHNSFKKNEVNSKECGEFYNLVAPDILPVSSSRALQKLIDLFELVILSKDHLGFISIVIETLLSITRKCKDSNSISIFETLAEKSTLAAFKMCKFILEKTKQSLHLGPKMDNVELSLKAIESILCITNINSKLNMKFMAHATEGMSEVEIFLFIRTIIECKSLPIPKLNELQPFCSKVTRYATVTAVPEKKYYLEKVPEFHTSLNMTVDPQKCDLANEKVKVKNEAKLSNVCSTSIAKYNVRNKFNESPAIKESLDNAVVAQKLLKETPSNAKTIYGYQNIQNTSTYNDFSNGFEEPEKTSDSVLEPVAPSFTREQLEKIVENFHCFDETIQSAIKGYLLELSQTPENADYARRLLSEVKKLS